MKVGFVYDWDMTLTEEFQTYPIFRRYIKNLSKEYKITEPDQYWDLSNGIDSGVGYMQQMIIDCEKKIFPGLNNEIMRDDFAKQIKLSRGLPEWFEGINKNLINSGCSAEHHIISAGIRPLIEGSPIFEYFTSIIAGEFLEKDENIYKIKSIVDPFRKVEFFKKISKGTHLHEDLPLEKYNIKHRNTFIFGDGQSDIDLFRYVRQRGGIVVAVFEPGNSDNFNMIVNSMRMNEPAHSYANLLVPRDYSKGSILEREVNEEINWMMKSEKFCDFPFELVRNWKLNHYSKESEISSLIKNHFNDCKYCQHKFQPRSYFE